MRQNALPILEDAGVDLVLSGHSHSYERSFLIDGHYGHSSTLQPSMILDGGDGRPAGDGAYRKPSSGLSPHEGAVYTVAGSSGKTSGGSLDHPVMFVSLDVLGSLVLDVQANRLDATFLRSTGVVADTFTLEKGCGTVATVDVSPASASVEVGATAQLTAVPRDGGGNALSGCPVGWSSSPPGPATVSATGLVTGVAVGAAIVTAATQGVSGASSITVVSSTNNAPTLDAVSDPVGTEGASVALSASFSDLDPGDVHTATVDWGDGSPVQAGTVDQDNDTFAAAHVYADDGVYTVTVMVSDGRGGVGQGAARATISNVPPTASAGGPYSGVEGSPITLTGTASDPGADALSFEWDFDYDGFNFQAEATGATAPHTYALDGLYTVALRVTDDHVSVLATATVTVTNLVLYLSLGSNATLPGGLSVANKDILAFDGSGFSLHFDGSDVGLSSFTIDAFTVVSPTEILLSFTSSGTVGGVSMDDSDVLRFTATSLGSNTAGTFSMYFDGSDVGLTTSDEDVDAIERLADGRLLLSTTGAVSVTCVSSGADEDLLEFTPTSLGATTAGAWRLYFDGSDVGLTSSEEDVDAAAVDAAGKIYLSTIGSFAVSGISGADEDVFVFVPTLLGSTTQGTFPPSLFFDGSGFGLGAYDVFAIDLP